MDHTSSLFRFFFLPALLTTVLSGAIRAADGFDTNYVGGDANQLSVTINGLNQAVLFGPGLMSPGTFFIPVPNGTSNDQGQVSSFVITGAYSSLRSAYFDRVLSTALYYRIYPVSGVPPLWTVLNLQEQSGLLPGTCYTSTQLNNWQINQSVNVLQGLNNGDYVLEFYIQSELYDVGLEDGSCDINALEQCNTSQIHAGRYISSRFNTTDPTACDLSNIIAGQSDPTKILFQVINAPLPVELTYFRGLEENGKVRLRWETALEQDLDDFLLEHSANGLDWSALSELTALGNSDSLHDYSFLDERPFFGENYYRLQARSLNGHIDMAPVIEINLTGNQRGLSVWPNPVRDILHYSVQESSIASPVLRIFDVAGRLVAEQPSDGPGDMLVTDFEEGLYFLEMYDSGGRVGAARFVKVK
ncbi:MAG: T9SS type A sorting domain-containing protein [Saprospiraceae bacterium]|nr:T9SS type A sorting domain-containing protein [Saprospiraceae bacterium]